MSRQRSFQKPPPAKLDDFPTTALGADADLFRCHRASRGPWWFSGLGHGRFDLAPPRGTCYLGLDEVAAVREAIGPEIVEFGFITAEFAAARRVSRLRLPKAHRVADLTASAVADFGVTRELSAMTSYDVPQQWATALARRADGILYQPRFSTGPDAQAVAIFGEMGDPGWPHPSGRESISLAVAARRAGIDVRQPPSAVTIVQPPE
ncbi:RES domain-containing protein [Gordonia sp. LSe1-13]|uniref:RES domain-containing protein n=1 Tax=Gordonia sesuvii TaxID=3116777 RepID=A0ABU7ME68_9ACTN|nr:RES domain-containing protein [Gordonia sp. LSe1-13]